MNPHDQRVRDWGLLVEGRFPVVLGNDIAGIVERLGPGTSSTLQPGDHVFGQTNYLKGSSTDQCGLQEYAVLDAYTVARVPNGLNDDDGASLVCNIVAPFWAIFGAYGLGLTFPFADDEAESPDYGNQTIVILGAGSNCGKYAVQICALAGFGTIVATADAKKNEAELRRYGATHIVDRYAENAEQQIRAIVDDDLVYAFDAVNVDHTLGVSLLSNTKKGTLVCIVPGQAAADKVGKKAAGYQEKFTQGQSHNQPELGAKFWKWLPVWMTEGKVKATAWDVLEGLDADKVNNVLNAYRDGKPPSKQVHVHLCIEEKGGSG